MTVPGDTGRSRRTTAPGAPGTPGAAGREWRATVPETAEIMAWIETITARGIRRPGYPADAWTERWAAGLLAGFGLDVRLAPVEVPTWHPVSATLRAHLDADPARSAEVETFALPYTTPRATVTAPLDRPAGSGRIAVREHTFAELPQTFVRELATAVHDPEGAFDELVRTLSFAPGYLEDLDGAVASGVAGYAGALTGVPWETRDYYVPYDAVRRPVPAVFDSADTLDMVDEVSLVPLTRAAIRIVEGTRDRSFR
ncbi:hypothetical protein [Streptosporangium vulgare]|uniref:Uncharacterized protein n=1 Tax=Streptosporangium vulgare TaxID=46190 RepID=A0ABV5TTY2_9ACTN